MTPLSSDTPECISGNPLGYSDGVPTREITLENLPAVVAENDVVLLDFWAAWCGPCRMFAPVFERASEANPDVVFGKVDTEAQQQLAGIFGITSIPTLVAFRSGVVVFAQPGALPASALDELIGAVRALDMDEVRAQLAAEREAAERVAVGPEATERGGDLASTAVRPETPR